MLRACSAVQVFDFFHFAGLATHPHRHHCLVRRGVNTPRSLLDRMKSQPMYKLYSMQRSGNSYKVRLALALLNAPYRAIEVDILRGESRTPDFLAKNPSGQVPLLEVGGRTLPRRVQRHPLVRRRRHLAGAGIADRARRSAAMDVLRTARAGAEYRCGLFLAVAGQGRPRPADPCAGRLDGARLRARLQVMENHLKTIAVFRRRPAHGRRHRALRLHPCRRPLRLRPGDLPRDPRLAEAGRADPRLRHHGLAARRPKSTIPPASPPGLE